MAVKYGGNITCASVMFRVYIPLPDLYWRGLFLYAAICACKIEIAISFTLPKEGTRQYYKCK